MSTTNQPEKTQEEIIESILPKIEQLEQALADENEGIENWLTDINEDLRQYPELVHLLNDEQIKPIYSAIRKKTDIAISTKKAKKKGAPKSVLNDGSSAADWL